MIETKIMEFGKGVLSTNFWLESDTQHFLDYIKISAIRRSLCFSQSDVYFPILDVELGNDFNKRPNLLDGLKNAIVETPTTFGSFKEYRNGYILVGVSIGVDTPEIIKRYRNTNTLNNTEFNDQNFRVPNVLNGLEADIESMLGNGTYDFILILIVGDGLDYYNGYREYYNRSNTTLKTVKSLDASTSVGYQPLKILNELGTSMNVRKLEKDCYDTRMSGNRPNSRPLDYSISYFGKVDTKSRKIVEEMYTYDIRGGRYNGTFNITTNFNTGDLLSNHSSLDPIGDKYIYQLTQTDVDLSKNGWEILYGVDKYIPYNIFSKPFDGTVELIGEPYTHEYYGHDYTLYNMVHHNKIDSDNCWVIENGIKIGEIK